MKYDIFTSESAEGLEVLIETPCGALRQRFCLPAEGLALGSFSLQAMRLCDAIAALARKIVRARECAITCAKGCGACCRQLVTLSIPEALQLLDTLERLASAEQQCVRARFAANSRQVLESGLLGWLMRLNDPVLEAHEHYAIAQKYFALSLPCPFLDPAGENCSIYHTRFATCREYQVCSPRANCDDPFLNWIEPVELPYCTRDALAALAAGLLHEPVRLISLGMAPTWGEANVELRRQRWPAKRLLDLFLVQVEVMLGGINDSGWEKERLL